MRGNLERDLDHPSTVGATHEGFATHDAERRIERLYVDVVNYKDWVYVDLHRRRTERTVAPSTLTGAWDGRSGVSYHQVELPSTFSFPRIAQNRFHRRARRMGFVLHHYDVAPTAAQLSKPRSPASKIFLARAPTAQPSCARPSSPTRGANTAVMKI